MKIKYLILLSHAVKGETPNITNLATTSALTVVETKIPSTINLVKKTDHKSKINECEMKIIDHDHSNKYLSTPELNKLAAEN